MCKAGLIYYSHTLTKSSVAAMAENTNMKLFLTGASGLLGRTVLSKFEAEGWNIFGIALTRVKNNLHKLDLTKKDDVRKALMEFQPHFVIHCAAQRFPDKVDSDPEAARLINVVATGYIIDIAGEIGIPVLYISTDYVFDGKKGKPYTINDKPNPVNLYGKTKLEGENITLQNSGNLVLRIPVLYGPVLTLKESAVTCLLEHLLVTDKVVYISNLEQRCPSHVGDIALICFQLACARLKDISVNGIFQWCGEEKMTKYQMVLKIAELFDMPKSHIQPDLKQVASASRPLDTELDRSRLAQLGFGHHTIFSNGIRDELSSWIC